MTAKVSYVREIQNPYKYANRPSQRRKKEAAERGAKNSERLNRQIAKLIQGKLTEDRIAMRIRLKNWGIWINRNNRAEVDHDTGQIRVSISGRIIAFAPHADVSGYHEPPPAPIDEADAMVLNHSINKLDETNKAIIKGVFEERLSNKFLSSIWRCTERTVINRCNGAIDALAIV